MAQLIVKTDDIEATEIGAACEEIEAKKLVPEGIEYGYARGELIEMIASHIISHDTDYVHDRINLWLEGLKAELSESEIMAGLGNGDIDRPDWLSISESTDHIKIWDNETMASNQMGFLWLEGDDD